MRVAILADFPLGIFPSSPPALQAHQSTAPQLPPLAEKWAEEDTIDKYWITICTDIEKPERFTFWNQTFIALPSPLTGRSSSFFKANRAAIVKVLDEIKPDLVHAWGTEDAYGLTAVTSGYPSLVSMQGILSHYVLRAKMSFRTWWLAAIELYVLRKGMAFTCESPWATNVLGRRVPRAKISTIEYAIHPDFFNATWQPDPLRPIALFAGTLDDRKGLKDALAAFARSDLANFELWIIGSGPLARLANSTPSNIKWLGQVGRAGLIEAMKKAWCMVMPTRADTGPLVVKEARVMGLPVITTPYGGQSNYIQDGHNGFFVEPGDIGRLTSCLRLLLSDYDFCIARGGEGWKENQPSFQAGLMAEKFRDLYIKLGAS